MVNPFGDESDSIFAWKERYKQQQFQTQTLQTRVTELKLALDEIMEKYEFQTNEFIQMKEDLSNAKQELMAYKKIAKEREEKAQQYEKQLDQSGLDKIVAENKQLKGKIEQLQAEYTRGSIDEELSSKIATTIMPLMLREFDPENSAYESAFRDLVEAVIADGDAIEKIIGILIKYGGSGPLRGLKTKINAPDFDVAIDVLLEEGIIKKIDEDLVLVSSENSVLTGANWDEMTVEEIFDHMTSIMEGEPDKIVTDSLEKFRDVLQEKNVPMTTMLFQIRKLIEGIQKKTINRKDGTKQIDEWRAKVVS